MFRNKLATHFAGPKLKTRTNPYFALVNLPIHRFVTSNYDCELEEALVKERGGNRKDYIYRSEAFGKKSFTQMPKYDEQLAIFSIAYANYDPLVFHCHGWYAEPAPVEFALNPGSYEIKLELEGYATPLKMVEVNAGKRIQVEETLTKK
jgi:hypothetical protein